MGRLFTFLAVVGGLALCFSWITQSSPDRGLAVVTAIAPKGEAIVATTQPVLYGAPELVRQGSGPAVAPQAQRPPPAAPSPARVTAAAPAFQPAPVPAPLPGHRDVRTGGVDGRAPAATALSRGELVVQLQRELRRVGCYTGDVTGDWGAGSRRAMAQFNARVNASLPVDQPDAVLLALVQNHTGSVCGRDCPTGEVLAEGGQCLPKAVMAQVNKGGNWATVTKAAPAPQVAPWTTTAQRKPSLVPAQPAAAPVATVEPLPGRMAIGAPVPAEADGVAAPGYAVPGQPPAIVIYRSEAETAAARGWAPPVYAAPVPHPAPPVKKAKAFNKMPQWALRAFGE